MLCLSLHLSLQRRCLDVAWNVIGWGFEERCTGRVIYACKTA
jgi:hypothetical protein